MRVPGPAPDEAERLAALASYEILDTAPEACFDELTELAAFVCKTPIALISLVDERRQWFKARVGIEASETSRELSFCGHVVERGEPLLVADARTDVRFFDNPFVTGDPHVISYFGMPLASAEGHTLGTLCAIDHVPRELDPEQRRMLDKLAHVVVRHLELHRSERRRAALEAELHAAVERERMATYLRQRFFEVSLDMLGISNFEGYFTELNPAWTKTLGWTLEELQSIPFLELVHPDDRERTISEAAALMGGEHVTVHFENRYRTKSGEYRWLSWASVPDVTNGVLLGTARDITVTKQREQELMVARQQAELANRAKSDFLTKMSHELRTPLNSVIGFTKLLHRNKKGNLDEQDLVYLDKIAKNGIHLLSLINDLLDLSKIEAGHAELTLQDVDLPELLRAIYDELEGVVRAEGNVLVVDLPERLAPIAADPRRLKQILINLIGNANKFTRQGVIELRVVAEQARALRIDIVDGGIGIPADKLELVFEAFRQVSEGSARTHGGTGLGLAISRSLAQLHGFELGVASVAGEGATFYLRLTPDAPPAQHRRPSWPALPSEPHAAPLRVPAPVDPHRLVLVIEDDADARLLAARAVEQVGARIVCADSGEAGLAVASALVPDLVVLDLGLPDMHGHEVVRRLAADPRLRHIPVVLYSGMPERELAVGAVTVLEKPVTLDAIAAVVGEQLGRRRRVLVIDDDADTREVLREQLRRMNVDVLEAEHGERGLEVLRRESVDLVLLDVCMPTMTGFEFLTHLRSDPALSGTPVVVCTVLDLAGSERADLDRQTSAIVQKGDEIEQRLGQILRDILQRPSP